MFVFIMCSEFFNNLILLYKLLCRFGGAEFPPIIMFKIFIHSGGHGVKYYCGKRVIKPASEVTKNSLMFTFASKFSAQNTVLASVLS